MDGFNAPRAQESREASSLLTFLVLAAFTAAIYVIGSIVIYGRVM